MYFAGAEVCAANLFLNRPAFFGMIVYLTHNQALVEAQLHPELTPLRATDGMPTRGN